jgi:hypothetical protein
MEGSVTYFYDGYIVDNKIQTELLKTQLPSGKNFSVGFSDETGPLTQLNIWDYEIARINFIPMSAGGFNVHGSVLYWSKLARFAPNENIHWHTDIYLPGKEILMLYVMLRF